MIVRNNLKIKASILIFFCLIFQQIQCDEFQQYSKVIRALVKRYDPDQKGAINKQLYDDFLYDIFQGINLMTGERILPGDQLKQLPSNLDKILKSALYKFCFKYKQMKLVPVREFYMDMLQNFKDFLIKAKKSDYNQLIEFYSKKINASDQKIIEQVSEHDQKSIDNQIPENDQNTINDNNPEDKQKQSEL